MEPCYEVDAEIRPNPIGKKGDRHDWPGLRNQPREELMLGCAGNIYRYSVTTQLQISERIGH